MKRPGIVLFFAGILSVLAVLSIQSPKRPSRPDAVTLTFVGAPIEYSRLGMAVFAITNYEAYPIYVDTVLVQVIRPLGWYEDFAKNVTDLDAEVSEWQAIGGHPDQTRLVGPGSSALLYVDWPHDRTWRVCVGYGKPARDFALWKANLREAWHNRSLSKWVSKNWNFGQQLISKEIASEITAVSRPSPSPVSLK